MDIIGHVLQNLPVHFTGEEFFLRLRATACALAGSDRDAVPGESLAILILSGRPDVSRRPEGVFTRDIGRDLPLQPARPEAVSSEPAIERAAVKSASVAGPLGARESAMADLQSRIATLLRDAVNKTGEGSPLSQELRGLMGLTRMVNDG